MKIRVVGVELFHGDRKTDMTKLIVALRNVANALKNYQGFGKNSLISLVSNEKELYLEDSTLLTSTKFTVSYHLLR
jgi:hypothetical protein